LDSFASGVSDNVFHRQQRAFDKVQQGLIGGYLDWSVSFSGMAGIVINRKRRNRCRALFPVPAVLWLLIERKRLLEAMGERVTDFITMALNERLGGATNGARK